MFFFFRGIGVSNFSQGVKIEESYFIVFREGKRVIL